MTKQYLQPRVVAPRPFRRWSIEVCRLLARNPGPIAGLVLLLIAYSTMLRWLSRLGHGPSLIPLYVLLLYSNFFIAILSCRFFYGLAKGTGREGGAARSALHMVSPAFAPYRYLSLVACIPTAVLVLVQVTPTLIAMTLAHSLGSYSLPFAVAGLSPLFSAFFFLGVVSAPFRGALPVLGQIFHMPSIQLLDDQACSMNGWLRISIIIKSSIVYTVFSGTSAVAFVILNVDVLGVVFSVLLGLFWAVAFQDVFEHDDFEREPASRKEGASSGFVDGRL